jgi:L-xylulokinase
MSQYLMGIDNGGTLSKAAIYDLNGKEIVSSSVKTRLIMPEAGFIERDMNELWEANVQVIRDVIIKSGVNPESIIGVSTTGHGNGMYPVDKNGEPAYNGIISTDTRAKDYVTEWYQNGTFDRTLPKTMQSLWAAQPVALLAWFKDHNPEVYQRIKWVFMLKDFIRYRLTGEAYAEITDISGTNLLNVKEVRYDTDLLKEFGLEDALEKLPPIKYSAEICGYVTPKAAQLTGLKEGTPVAGGLFDIDACAIATGLTDSSKMCVIAGTWSINEYISQTPAIERDLFMNSIYCMKGYWLTTDASPTSANNLEWFLTEFMGEESRIAEEKNISVFTLFDNMVANVKPEDVDILFLPFLYGTNVDADAKACFIGLNGWHTKEHVLRSIYEGVAFSHFDHINRLLKLREMPECIRISGGASRSKVWVQIFADVFQIPIEVTKATELGTLGAALCAGIATGHFKSFESAADSMVEVSYTCKPNPQNKEIYRHKYANYKKAIEILAPLWKTLS